jgi:hypothetical protein
MTILVYNYNIMRIKITTRQLENLSKLFWDLAKICISAFVIYPFVKDTMIISGIIFGVVISLSMIFFALKIDNIIKE